MVRCPVPPQLKHVPSKAVLSILIQRSSSALKALTASSNSRLLAALILSFNASQMGPIRVLYLSWAVAYSGLLMVPIYSSKFDPEKKKDSRYSIPSSWNRPILSANESK